MISAKPLRPPQDERLHDLIAECYERASTILTSNLDFTEWAPIIPGSFIPIGDIWDHEIERVFQKLEKPNIQILEKEPRVSRSFSTGD